MEKEIRKVCFDSKLGVEAYHFKGIMQKFPNHFHKYYVLGFIERGTRNLNCKNQDFVVETGDLLLFNPHDNHTCSQIDAQTLDYRCINIETQIMQKAVFEITGETFLPCFAQPVIFQSDLIFPLKELHLLLMQDQTDFKKEELFYFLLEELINNFTNSELNFNNPELSSEIKLVCEFLENNYTQNISLESLSKITGLSKYYLLRCFTKQKGITPYSYLETIRIENAKKLLQQGIVPIDVAIKTGFSDQSHFTNFFKKFIGLTPKQYLKIFTK